MSAINQQILDGFIQDMWRGLRLYIDKAEQVNPPQSYGYIYDKFRVIVSQFRDLHWDMLNE